MSNEEGRMTDKQPNELLLQALFEVDEKPLVLSAEGIAVEFIEKMLKEFYILEMKFPSGKRAFAVYHENKGQVGETIFESHDWPKYRKISSISAYQFVRKEDTAPNESKDSTDPKKEERRVLSYELKLIDHNKSGHEKIAEHITLKIRYHNLRDHVLDEYRTPASQL